MNYVLKKIPDILGLKTLILKIFIACQKELRDYDKVISGLRKKTKKVKVTKEQKAVRKEAESLFKNFRAGEKLTTDDILLLQRSKLI